MCLVRWRNMSMSTLILKHRSAAEKRGEQPRAISDDTLEAIKKIGKTRAETCRIFGVKRGTLDDYLKRVGYV